MKPVVAFLFRHRLTLVSPDAKKMPAGAALDVYERESITKNLARNSAENIRPASHAAALSVEPTTMQVLPALNR